MSVAVSVVVPARDAAATLGECLHALQSQSLARDDSEVIVVVDGRSHDETRGIATRPGVRVLAQSGRGAGGARNDGVLAATGELVAFTDADCIPSRRWLASLVEAAHRPSSRLAGVLGVAGPTLGYHSETAAARFVDLTGGLQAQRHLAHPRYPWAPTTNVVYRRDALLAVGGFDPRFVSYEGCDLHTRLARRVGGEFRFEPRAVVLHRHRAGWDAYWRQQHNYGRGYAQFFRRYAAELPWTATDEARAWLAVGLAGLRALQPGSDDERLLRRGDFVKQLAQRTGFATTFWSPGEAARWRSRAPLGELAAP